MNFHRHKPASAAGATPVDETPTIRPVRDVPREMPVPPPPPLPDTGGCSPPSPSAEQEGGEPADQTEDPDFLDAGLVMCIAMCCLVAIFSFLTGTSGEAPEAWIVFGAALLLWILLGIYGLLRRVVKMLRAIRQDLRKRNFPTGEEPLP